jgi:hypothetical protein
VDVNTKNDYGDTPLIVTCQQTTLETEEEAVKFINYLWQSGSKFKKSNDFGKTAMIATQIYIKYIFTMKPQNVIYDNRGQR